jgi:bifunctional non-homologous end joining protein LigD
MSGRIKATPRRPASQPGSSTLSGAKPAPFPAFIKPALATLRDKVPTGAGFVHELKLDGYRVQAHLHEGRVKLFTRSGLDWTQRFAPVAADIGRLPAKALVLDGEIISADADGRPNFSALQDDIKRGRLDRMVFYAFDLMHLDGFDTRAASLLERKKGLQSVLSDPAEPPSRILYSEHFKDGADLYGRAMGMGLEGIVSKKWDAPYRSGRTEQWIKVKCWKRGRFAVVGFVPEGSGGLLKLRLARREGDALVYVGRVGTGWDRKMASDVRRALEPLARPTAPLAKPLKKPDTTWVEPRFDAEITFAEITDDGMVRHPVFKRLVS